MLNSLNIYLRKMTEVAGNKKYFYTKTIALMSDEFGGLYLQCQDIDFTL